MKGSPTLQPPMATVPSKNAVWQNPPSVWALTSGWEKSILALGSRQRSHSILRDSVKSHQDAYGHAIYDVYNGKYGYEVFQREDGYFGVVGGPQTYFQEYEQWPPHQKESVKHAFGRVLDVGCGACRHALYLQSKGMEVVGIDSSPLAIKVCKLRGVRHAKVLPITRVSSKLGTFDTILMMGTNFSLFENMKRARWLLRRFHAITHAGSVIIAESYDPYQSTEPCHLRYGKLNRKRGRMTGQLRVRIRYMTYATPWFDYLLVSQDEMKEILRGTGWQVQRFFDGDGPIYAVVIAKEPSTRG